MTKKQIGRTIAFVLVVCILLIGMCDIFELTDESYIPARFQKYYSLEKDTVDAVWIGTSGVDRYWIASKAYDEYGMTVYPLSSDHLGSWLFVNLLDEALKTQNPELVIVDLRAFAQVNDDLELADTRARRVLDAMKPFSSNRLKVAFKTMDIRKQIDSTSPSFDLSYLLSFMKYHSMWAEDDFSLVDSVSHKECSYMGFFLDEARSVRPINHTLPRYRAKYKKALDPITSEALYELLDYLEEKNLNALFINTPGKMTVSESGRVNTTCQILEERGIPYINYCLTEEDGTFTLFPEVDYVADYYNRNHVNYYGAEKFTQMFSAYINENYDLPDRRSQETVKADWDGVYDLIKSTINKWEKPNKNKKTVDNSTPAQETKPAVS